MPKEFQSENWLPIDDEAELSSRAKDMPRFAQANHERSCCFRLIVVDLGWLLRFVGPLNISSVQECNVPSYIECMGPPCMG